MHNNSIKKKNNLSISVVIPTFNRSKMIKDLVDQLINQTLDKESYEILIIDDGSVDCTARTIKKMIKLYPNIKYYKIFHGGPGRARNYGIKRSIGDIVVFTDDDCLPDKNWLKVIVSIFGRNLDISGIEGLTFTRKENITPLTHQVTNESGEMAYPTCNIAYRSSWLKAEGGFDEYFKFPHNEDIELAWRMLKYGPIIFSRRMIVYHPPRKEKFSKMLKRMPMLSSEFYLYHKHKDNYKRKRALNPWINIYFRYIFKFKMLDTISRVLKFQSSKIIAQSIMLMCFSIIYLIILFPHFLKIDQESKKECEFRLKF